MTLTGGSARRRMTWTSAGEGAGREEAEIVRACWRAPTKASPRIRAYRLRIIIGFVSWNVARLRLDSARYHRIGGRLVARRPTHAQAAISLSLRDRQNPG